MDWLMNQKGWINRLMTQLGPPTVLPTWLDCAFGLGVGSFAWLYKCSEARRRRVRDEHMFCCYLLLFECGMWCVKIFLLLHWLGLLWLWYEYHSQAKEHTVQNLLDSAIHLTLITVRSGLTTNTRGWKGSNRRSIGVRLVYNQVQWANGSQIH